MWRATRSVRTLRNELAPRANKHLRRTRSVVENQITSSRNNNTDGSRERVRREERIERAFHNEIYAKCPMGIIRGNYAD